MPSRSKAVKGVGRPAIPRALERRLELLEAAQSHARHQFIAVAEMPIGRRGAHPGEAGRLCEGESRRPLGRDQFQRGADPAPRANCRDDSRAEPSRSPGLSFQLM